MSVSRLVGGAVAVAFAAGEARAGEAARPSGVLVVAEHDDGCDRFQPPGRRLRECLVPARLGLKRRLGAIAVADATPWPLRADRRSPWVVRVPGDRRVGAWTEVHVDATGVGAPAPHDDALAVRLLGMLPAPYPEAWTSRGLRFVASAAFLEPASGATDTSRSLSAEVHVWVGDDAVRVAYRVDPPEVAPRGARLRFDFAPVGGGVIDLVVEPRGRGGGGGSRGRL